MSTELTPRVVVVGGGPAGLRAATELAGLVRGEVLVLEREAAAGGIPRHSDHLGYGVRDLGRFVSGPRYARLLRERATAAGVQILTHATATDWDGERALLVTAPTGRIRVAAGAVVLATGARERPRPARLLPGDRAEGVFTTGQLQNLVHLKHRRVGHRAVVVGAELVSWSAALTLRHAGCRTVLMTTEHPRPDCYRLVHGPGRFALGTRVATGTRVTGIYGRPRVTAVEIEQLGTGRRRRVACDTVLLTGDWIPDNELVRAAGIAIDPASSSPLVDTAQRTDRPGVFAVGNLAHPVDTADVAALDGAAVAGPVRDFLAGHRPEVAGVELRAAGPLRWLAPHLLRPGDPMPARGRLLAWPQRYVRTPTVVVSQDGREVTRRRLWWPAAPGRVFRIPAGVLAGVDRKGGPVTIDVRGG